MIMESERNGKEREWKDESTREVGEDAVGLALLVTVGSSSTAIYTFDRSADCSYSPRLHLENFTNGL